MCVCLPTFQVCRWCAAAQGWRMCGKQGCLCGALDTGALVFFEATCMLQKQPCCSACRAQNSTFPPPLRLSPPQVVVCDMHYEWTSPAHDTYKELFERVLSVAPGLDEFEVRLLTPSERRNESDVERVRL